MPENCGFERTYTPTIMDGPVIRWKIGYSTEVSASRNGVLISGAYMLSYPADYERFEKLLALARSVSSQFARRVEPASLDFGKDEQ